MTQQNEARRLAKVYHESIFSSIKEAFENSEMIVVFVDRKAKSYGPVYGFSKKLTEIDIDNLARRQAGMHSLGSLIPELKPLNDEEIDTAERLFLHKVRSQQGCSGIGQSPKPLLIRLKKN